MGYTINEVPERVTAMRKQWAESDAKRDKGLTEPEEIEKYRDISYGPYDKWNLLDVYVPKENPNHVASGVKSLTLNGEALEGNLIPASKLKDKNEVVVVLG